MPFTLAAAVAALLLTTVLAGLLRALALRWRHICAGLLDRPAGHKAHARPTPHLGGVAVAVGTLGAASSGPWTGQTLLGREVGTLLMAGAAVAVLGLVDDLRPLGPRVRLLVETGAAGTVAYGSGLGMATGALAVLWIVFVTNAFNLLDNSDGATGTVAAITALGLAICAAAEGRTGLALLLCVLAAALIGFLWHNWHPARIFLGDCGSLFTGFVLSSAAVLLHTGHTPARTTGALLAFTLVVTADTALVLVSRHRQRHPLLLGGTDHIAHRLRMLGLTVPGTAVVLGVIAFVGTLIGLLIHHAWLPPSAVLPVAGAAVLACGGMLKVPVYGPGRVGRPRRRGHRTADSARAARAVDVARG
ncbi:MraY family glycosyltransferase [Streptomyces sp. NPDC013953]|uniref:MraY family glycosyltransferase n=1 Tax=Streptomyces sp. NPDC013953 TaxID=3364868 RepID=UPI0036FD70BF